MTAGKTGGRIGILGGTFNPVHLGHTRMAEAFLDCLQLDRLLLVPANLPPHKEVGYLADGEHRLAMCRLAARNLRDTEVLDYEIAQSGKSYTVKTLRHLHEVWPGSQFYLMMGADMFLTVQNWVEPEEIFRLAVLCAARRELEELTRLDRHKQELERLGASCVLIDMEPMPLSSTEVRQRLQEGRDLTGLLDPQVLGYINDHRLYR